MAPRVVLVVVSLLGAAACSLETSPLIGRAPVGNAGDADADADADADTDADTDGDADADGGPAPCSEGAVRSCGLEVGECGPGVETCRGGVWGACEDAVPPQPEQCDGRDQDCDGLADPDDPEADDQCSGLGARCIQRGGRPTCVYYPLCQTYYCCDNPGTCNEGYACQHVAWDCAACELCHCNYCYRD